MKTNDKTTKGATKNNGTEGKGRCGESTRMQKLLASLAPGEIVPVNADMAHVLETAYSVVPVARALRGRVLELLPGTNMERYDALEGIAHALSEAHAAYVGLASADDGLGAMLSEGVEVRALLDAEAFPMVKRGQLTAEQTRACMTGLGFVGVGLDLQAQQAMLRAIWPAIRDKSGVTIELLDRAKELGLALVVKRAGREKREALLREKCTERQRWFSLLVREYREIQRAVAYLRWSEGDADALAPSLWAKSGATRYKRDENSEKKPANDGNEKKPANDGNEGETTGAAKG